MLEVSQTLNVPKNSFRIFTVDKDGNETGKSIEDTNTWTYFGLRSFWLSTSANPSGQYAPDNGTTGATGIINIYISDSTEPITKNFTTFDRDEYWVSGSSTRVSVRNGVNYDARELVNINGMNYWRLRHLRSWAFGSLDRTVCSVAIRDGNVNTANSMWAGKLLNTPFVITDEEQLMVRYDILIPAEYVSHTSLSSMRYGDTNYTLNGVQHLVNVGKTPFVWSSDPSSNSTITFRYATFAMNHGNWGVNNDGSSNYRCVLENEEYLFGDNWRSAEWQLMIPPYPLGKIDISYITQKDSTSSQATPWNWNTRLYFEPPITKEEDERLIIKFKLRQEVTEYEP